MADHVRSCRMRGVALNPVPRNAMLRIFREAEAQADLSSDEQEALGTVVAAMTNFEVAPGHRSSSAGFAIAERLLTCGTTCTSLGFSGAYMRSQSFLFSTEKTG